jgi:hypothetical protein
VVTKLASGEVVSREPMGSTQSSQQPLFNFRAPWWIRNVSSEKIRVLMRSELAVSLDFSSQADIPE